MMFGLGLVVAGIIALAGCAHNTAPLTTTAQQPQDEQNSVKQVQDQGEKQEQTPEAQNPQSNPFTPQQYEVVYGKNGYQPETLTIKVGDKVVFNNESANKMWTASNVHPTHTQYPGTDIQKCFSGERGEMFDECAGADEGQKWAFTFMKEGAWGYHNHLKSSHLGTIIVLPSIQFTK